MSKILKSFFYIAGCVIVFVVVLKAYNGSLQTETASAFEWEKTVNVYFSNSQNGSDEDCGTVFPLARKVLNAESLGPGTLEALLKGPTDYELAKGYTTSLNSSVSVKSFDVRNGVAYVDFDKSFNQGVAGSCRVTAIMSQIEYTLDALPDIDRVVVSVDGQTEGILEP